MHAISSPIRIVHALPRNHENWRMPCLFQESKNTFASHHKQNVTKGLNLCSLPIRPPEFTISLTVEFASGLEFPEHPSRVKVMAIPEGIVVRASFSKN
jgi:hypothetical protein